MIVIKVLIVNKHNVIGKLHFHLKIIINIL